MCCIVVSSMSLFVHTHILIIHNTTQRYPIGLWLGEMNGERGIFDSKCTVPCASNGTPNSPINEADWQEVSKRNNNGNNNNNNNNK
jgi:hypothetical protein